MRDRSLVRPLICLMVTYRLKLTRRSVRPSFTQKSAIPTAPPACKAKHSSSLSTRGISNDNNPLLKRIAQTDLPAVAQSWQNLCIVSGGARPANNDLCVQLAGINRIHALLVNADACAAGQRRRDGQLCQESWDHDSRMSRL